MTTQNDNTQNDETFEPIMPYELQTPKLKPRQRAMLWAALNLAAKGVPVFASALYPKQTESKPRHGEKDYTPMPGVSQFAQFGPIVRVFRRKKDQAVRFTIWSVPRQGFTTIIPDGLEEFEFFPTPEQSLYRPEEPA